MMLECPVCEGMGQCDHCDNGFMRLDRCPRDIMGGDFIEAVNMAAICGKGDWPVAGGIYDQSSWFVNLYQQLKSNENRIESEKQKSNGP